MTPPSSASNSDVSFPWDDALQARLEEVARSPVLLVACDYDGTLAPIVDDPSQAHPRRESIVAIKALAAMPQTHVAVISGRALSDLASLTGNPDEVHLVGSHGSEFDPDFAARLRPQEAELRRRVAEELEQIARSYKGAALEYKPASIAFHYRQVAEEDAEQAYEAVMQGPAAVEGVFTKQGKKVVELGVVATNKGAALETIRHRVGATAAIFLGDDITDEDAFHTLLGPDMGVKVGEGPTQAAFRVRDTEDIARLLAVLSEARQRWLAGCEAIPINALSMLSDQRTAALLSPDARIIWMCAPRIDSPSLFAELLGGPSAGYFSVAPADDGAPDPSQTYDGDSFLLHTRWRDISVTDYLDCSGGRPMQRAGRLDLIRFLHGSGRARIEFAPRLDFGRTATRLRERDGGLEVEESHEPIVLRSPGVEWTIQDVGAHQTAVAEVDLARGPVALELRYGTGSLSESIVPEHQRRAQTERFWSEWAATLTLPRLRPDLVLRSALVLRALCHLPTGAICAAATTSLPEHLGGVRNWDYRYCWPRDAAMSAAALVRLGSNWEAMRLLDWMLDVVESCESADRLAPIYTVTGRELGPEAEISELSGYGGSRPVRVGNAASRQIQLDVYAPIVDLVYVLMERGAPLSSQHWGLVQSLADAVTHRWQDPDHGIWEARVPRRHHVHSKVMCWLTLDRAARISEQFLGRPRKDYLECRDWIRDEVLEHGYNKERNCFTADYDNGHMDAAALAVGLCGLIEPDDPRFVGTVKAVEDALRVGPTVYRYRYDDGLPGVEGGFHLCTTWLIESYAMIGRMDKARALFDDFIRLAGPTGLIPEQHDPVEDRPLGNHPQAYSHLGLINAALRLSQ